MLNSSYRTFLASGLCYEAAYSSAPVTRTVQMNAGVVSQLAHYCFLQDSFIHSCHSALRPVEQEPEPSQATDMAVACRFVGKVLWVGCHYFPPAFSRSNLRRQVPPCLHDARDPSSEGWNYWARNGRQI